MKVLSEKAERLLAESCIGGIRALMGLRFADDDEDEHTALKNEITRIIHGWMLHEEVKQHIVKETGVSYIPEPTLAQLQATLEDAKQLHQLAHLQAHAIHGFAVDVQAALEAMVALELGTASKINPKAYTDAGVSKYIDALLNGEFQGKDN